VLPAQTVQERPGQSGAGPSGLSQSGDEVAGSEEQIALARELGASGIELYESGAYPEASKQLEHAYRYVKVPTTGLWSARALDKVGDLKGAAERYREVLAMPAEPNERQVFLDARRVAQQELDFLVPRIPKLVIRLHSARPEQVRVTVDDVELPTESIGAALLVNPGTRRIVGWMGERAERVTLDMPERSSGSAVLDFSPILGAPAAKPLTSAPVLEEDGNRKLWGYVALGIGGASLATGVVATVLASGQRSELDQNCPEQQCPPSFHGDVDTLDATLTLSLAGYAGAVVGLGVGGYLLLTATEDSGPESSSSASVWLGPGSAGIVGSF
jgi:hypothetical protein